MKATFILLVAILAVICQTGQSFTYIRRSRTQAPRNGQNGINNGVQVTMKQPVYRPPTTRAPSYSSNNNQHSNQKQNNGGNYQPY